MAQEKFLRKVSVKKFFQTFHCHWHDIDMTLTWQWHDNDMTMTLFTINWSFFYQKGIFFGIHGNCAWGSLSKAEQRNLGENLVKMKWLTNLFSNYRKKSPEILIFVLIYLIIMKKNSFLLEHIHDEKIFSLTFFYFILEKIYIIYT